jgi:hypothetical protein
MNINEIESVLESLVRDEKSCFLFPKVGCSIDEFVQQVAKECKPPNGPWIKMLSGTDRKTEPTNLIAILSDTFDQHLYTLLFNVPNREILIVDPLLDKHDPVNNNSITEFNDKVSLKLQKVLLEFIKLKSKDASSKAHKKTEYYILCEELRIEKTPSACGIWILEVVKKFIAEHGSTDNITSDRFKKIDPRSLKKTWMDFLTSLQPEISSSSESEESDDEEEAAAEAEDVEENVISSSSDDESSSSSEPDESDESESDAEPEMKFDVQPVAAANNDTTSPKPDIDVVTIFRAPKSKVIPIHATHLIQVKRLDDISSFAHLFGLIEARNGDKCAKWMETQFVEEYKRRVNATIVNYKRWKQTLNELTTNWIIDNEDNDSSACTILTSVIDPKRNLLTEMSYGGHAQRILFDNDGRVKSKFISNPLYHEYEQEEIEKDAKTLSGQTCSIHANGLMNGVGEKGFGFFNTEYFACQPQVPVFEHREMKWNEYDNYHVVMGSKALFDAIPMETMGAEFFSHGRDANAKTIGEAAMAKGLANKDDVTVIVYHFQSKKPLKTEAELDFEYLSRHYASMANKKPIVTLPRKQSEKKASEWLFNRSRNL